METDQILKAAREIVGSVKTALAITVDPSGIAQARGVWTGPLGSDWTLRFCTSRRTRKVADVERTGHLTIAYATDTAHVSLVGQAHINDDVATKQAGWTEAGYRWHPKGPTDPDVVYVEFTVEQIEIWSSSHGLLPNPAIGLWAYQLIRTPEGWRQRTTLPAS